MTTVDWQSVKNYSEIIFERAGKIAKITMNRPEKMNAFTPRYNSRNDRRVYHLS